MTWEYRVMRYVGGKGTTHWHSLSIYEVYDCPIGWTKEPVTAESDTIEGLRGDLEAMLAATHKPVLDYKTGKPIKNT